MTEIDKNLEELRYTNTLARGIAAKKLIVMGSQNLESVVQRLIDILCQPEDDRREIVANILGDIGKPSIIPLVSLLSHADKTVRQWAVYSLGHIGEKGIQIPVESLLGCLKDSDALVRGTAAVALGRYSGGSRYKGMPVAFSIEPLVESLKDSNVFVREQASWALGEIGDPRALPALEHIARTDKKRLMFPSSVAKKAREAIGKIQQRTIPN